jgi:hypothetical protein
LKTTFEKRGKSFHQISHSAALVDLAGLVCFDRCFTGGIEFLSAKLTDRQNLHPDGPCLQHFWLHEKLRGKFDHFLQMEPDVLPIQVRFPSCANAYLGSFRRTIGLTACLQSQINGIASNSG